MAWKLPSTFDQDLLALDLRADDLSRWDVGDLTDADPCHAPVLGKNSI